MYLLSENVLEDIADTFVNVPKIVINKNGRKLLKMYGTMYGNVFGNL